MSLKLGKLTFMKLVPIGLVLLLVVAACGSPSAEEKAIAATVIDTDLVRFDARFAKATAADIPQLKQEFPLFFPARFPDSIWEQRIQDTLQQQLNQAVLDAFPEDGALEEDLYDLLRHVKYYFRDFQPPSIIYTTTSDVDYRTRVIATDTLLILELDTYLGPEHEFYLGIPRYIAENLKPGQILPDVATAYSKQFITIPKQRSLIEQMVYFGKQLYLMDLWLPNLPDHEKIGYSQEQFQWALDNETDMWRYFVEKELLYSTDPKLTGRFISPAPFSKFNLEIDNESPGRLGRYMGWQIVRSYMEQNEASLDRLMALDGETLFKESKYKPKR